MAGRADGSAKKALFSPTKGDPPPQVKKKKESPTPKNAPPPDQKEKTPPKKSTSPDKNATPEKTPKKKKIVGQPPRKYRSMSTTCSSEQRPSPVKYRSMALCSIWRR